MRNYSITEIALNENLFYNFRSSIGVNDSIVSKLDEEKIGKLILNRKKQNENTKKVYEDILMKKLNLKNHDLRLFIFSEKINNSFSCTSILNEKVIQILFKFDASIIRNKNNEEIDIISNQTVTNDELLPLDSCILGFVDYIDLRSDIMNEYLFNLNENISFLRLKTENEFNEMVYIKILLRISFIKSICILKLFGKKVPIYLFDGSDLLIKIKPIFNNVYFNCYISYKLIENGINLFDSETYELNYNELRWYFKWRSKIDSLINNPKEMNIEYNDLIRNKRNKTCYFDEFKEQIIDNLLENTNKGNIKKNLPLNDNFLKKIDEKDRILDLISDNENSSQIDFKDEKELINELLSKQKSNFSIVRNKKKKLKQMEELNSSDSQDYVEKLIQQQTTELFNF